MSAMGRSATDKQAPPKVYIETAATQRRPFTVQSRFVKPAAYSFQAMAGSRIAETSTERLEGWIGMKPLSVGIMAPDTESTGRFAGYPADRGGKPYVGLAVDLEELFQAHWIITTWCEGAVMEMRGDV